jgi:hypothetical protein
MMLSMGQPKAAGNKRIFIGGIPIKMDESTACLP